MYTIFVPFSGKDTQNKGVWFLCTFQSENYLWWDIFHLPEDNFENVLVATFYANWFQQSNLFSLVDSRYNTFSNLNWSNKIHLIQNRKCSFNSAPDKFILSWVQTFSMSMCQSFNSTLHHFNQYISSPFHISFECTNKIHIHLLQNFQFYWEWQRSPELLCDLSYNLN